MQAFSKSNRGVRYLLTVIDVFSKYGWMLPLKDKTGKSVADAFKEIFKKSKWKPEKLWTDKGREFYNKHVKELGVELYSTENEEKSSVAERWNRTIKEKCSSISQRTIPTNILTFLMTLLRDTTTQDTQA